MKIPDITLDSGRLTNWQTTGRSWKKWKNSALVSLSTIDYPVSFIKPQEYMNNSGMAVSSFMNYFNISNNEILVISDDFAIPLGTLRLRQSGSAGGHNGLLSIIQHTGTTDFQRLRLGIGPVPENVDPADFVLSNFASSEKDTVNTMIENALETIEKVINDKLV